MFKAEITFLPGNNYPDSHHSQGGMKFATQISPLLNCYLSFPICTLTLSWFPCLHPDQIKPGEEVHFSWQHLARQHSRFVGRRKVSCHFHLRPGFEPGHLRIWLVDLCHGLSQSENEYQKMWNYLILNVVGVFRFWGKVQ